MFSRLINGSEMSRNTVSDKKAAIIKRFTLKTLILMSFGVPIATLPVLASEPSEKSANISQTTVNSNTGKWFEVAQQQTVTFTTPLGDVVIALHPALAPKHVARFKALINAKFYDNQHFYRVVDGFVAQAGSNDSHDATKFDPALLSNIDAEFTQPLSGNVVSIENKDMFAPETGFLDGFAVGIDNDKQQMWGLHCPGVVAFARNSEKDTASTEFYIVIGQAPRHLDRNMSVVGRVVKGMDVLQKLPRGNLANGGVLDTLVENSTILSAKVHGLQDSPYFIQTTNNEEFKQRIHIGKTLDNPFFHDNSYGPRPIDVCYHQTKATTTP